VTVVSMLTATVMAYISPAGGALAFPRIITVVFVDMMNCRDRSVAGELGRWDLCLQA
jgi:hypothetical protein